MFTTKKNKNNNKMQEKLINAVFTYPELYNPTLREYKDASRRSTAWRCVALQVGISEEEGKRRWRNLRDRYRKERLAEKRRRRDSVPDTKRPWRYMHLLRYLEPYLQDRPSSSHLDIDSSAADSFAGPECDVSLCSSPTSPDDGLLCPTPAPPAHPSTPGASRSPSPVVSGASQPRLPGDVTGGAGKKNSHATSFRHKRGRAELTDFEAQVLSALSAHHDEDYHYALSLAATMRKLPLAKKQKLRCRIEQCVYDVMVGDEH